MNCYIITSSITSPEILFTQYVKVGLTQKAMAKFSYSYRAFGNLQESKKFPVPNCFTSNRASNFFGNFGEISESFLKSE